MVRTAASILLFLQFLLTSNGQDIIVDLPEGKIAGHTLTSFRGNPYYAFQEIPYAAPPVGDLRFALPKNPEPWNGVLNTTQNTKQCYQSYPSVLYDPDVDQFEDCLYLNVYTPEKPDEKDLLPVYVWIHGGGLRTGTGIFSRANPGRLIDFGIVVVSINYRLGVLGFLTTEDGVIPGNIGLKDQRLALRWVKSRIERFGGDPNKITIGGESAGAVSVGHHLAGQNTEGLFTGAILQSGTSIITSCYTPDAKAVAFALGQAVDTNFNSSNSTDLLNLLRNASVEEMLNSSIAGATELRFAAVIENEIEEDALVTAPMHESFMNGNFHRVPLFMGINSEESLTFVGDNLMDIAASYDADPSLMINDKLNVPLENRSVLGNELKKLYTDGNFTEELGALVKYNSDSGLVIPITRHAELASQYVPTYFYQLSYMGSFGLPGIGGNRTYIPGAVGVQHGEDLSYLWDWGYPDNVSGDDLVTLERLLIFWTNFIKYQNPTPGLDQLLDNITWPTAESSNIQYLNINATLEVQSNPRSYKEISSTLFPYLQPPYIVV